MEKSIWTIETCLTNLLLAVRNPRSGPSRTIISTWFTPPRCAKPRIPNSHRMSRKRFSFYFPARPKVCQKRSCLRAGFTGRLILSSRATRSELRRQRREQEAFQMQQNSSADDTWKNVAPLLDEALSKLRETDRDAIILRFFQNESLGKVGQVLGVSEEAAA